MVELTFTFTQFIQIFNYSGQCLTLHLKKIIYETLSTCEANEEVINKFNLNLSIFLHFLR